MARPLFSPLNLARAAKLAALLLFLLPWATVSCSSGRLIEAAEFEMSGAPSMALARPSGLALATGNVRLLQEPPSAGASPPPNPLSRPDPFVAGGALLILLAFGLAFVRRGRIAALGTTALAIAALCYAIFVRLPRNAHDYALAMVAGDGRGATLDPRELVQMIEVRPEAGFWLTLLALIVAAVSLGLSLRANEGAPRP